MKLPLIVLSSIVAAASSAHATGFTMEELCSSSTGEPFAASTTEETPALKLHTFGSNDLILVDHGFCRNYAESLKLDGPKETGWKIRFYMSHSFTRYFNSDVSFHSSRYNVEIKDYEWAERGSRNFFNPSNWFTDGRNPAQMIDEPTNTFTISIEKGGNEFYLSAFHPKFLQAEHQVKYASGTIDGVPVNGRIAIDPTGSNEPPPIGTSPLIRNEFTYAQMLYEVGYGHKFTLLQSRIGNITYVPHVGVGFMMGKGYSVMTKPGHWYEFEDSE
jgi:hypothetical protein